MRKFAENEHVKKSLHTQILEMDSAIQSADKSLTAMKKRIDHYGEVDLVPKFDTTKGLLSKLHESKAVLEDDLHHKLVSMKIDEACRKITPERATGTDTEKLPIAAMLEGPKKKNQMNRTNSSPAFVGDNAARPGSPAGISSPLKAGGAAISLT